MRNLVAGFGVGVAVGAGGCYIYLTTFKPDIKRAGVAPDQKHKALKYGAPETHIVRQYDGYVAEYDYRTRNPKWVIEHITPASWTGEGNRDKSEFYPDPAIEPRFSAKLSDFRGSGYDRGHMAPAANHKDSQQAMDQTFSLVNISPQAGKGFNRDYWARLERFVKELTEAAGDVYCITGPLWLPNAADGEDPAKWRLQHDLIGQPPALVSVPTHYYKVVLADARTNPGGRASGAASPGGQAAAAALRRGGGVAVGAFVLPNAPIEPRTPLSAYVVPLDDLEQVAGVKFFPDFLRDTRRREVLDGAASAWRQQGMAELKPFERHTMKQAFAALPPPTTIEVEAVVSPSSSSTSSQASTKPNAPPAPKTPAGSGALHLCDVNACRLPSENFYMRGGGGGGGGSSSGSSSGRSASAGRR